MDASSAWSSHSDLDKKESDGRDLPEGVAPHAHRGVVGAPELITRPVSETPVLSVLYIFFALFIVEVNPDLGGTTCIRTIYDFSSEAAF